MHIRTDYWRFTIFTALGLASNACNSGPSWVSECGESTARKKEYARYDLAVCSGNGLAHRATNGVACESELPRPDDPASAAKRSEGECKSDTECTEKAYGHCADVSGPGGIPSYHCQYGCVSDSDCDDGQLCNCYSPIGLCVPSDCTQDSDCEDGMLCAEAYTKDSGCGVSLSYRCQHADDECVVHDDCPEREGGVVCHFDGARRVCESAGPVCGRPFLVEGAALLAPLCSFPFSESRGCVDLGPLDVADAAIREALGEYWAQIGLMEHASIAAFARFALQLMHVGAPHSLLAAAQQAMLDETEHAKACFGIASQLLGRSVGPGKLPIDQALTETSLEDIVRLTVREGCIGETVAAMEAAEAAALTSDPHVRAVLNQIQKDERTHAELAWRFVQWALSHEASVNPTAARSLRDVLRQEIAAAMAEPEPASEVVAPETERLGARYGVVPAATRAAIRRSALAGVVAPCAAELLRGFDATTQSVSSELRV